MPSDDVLIAIVGTFGVVLTALLSYLGITANITRKHTKATRDGVVNSHDIPLRDDLDDKFKGLTDQLLLLTKSVSKIDLDQGGMKSDIRGIRKDASDDRHNANEAIAAERERIRILEDTITPSQLKRLRDRTKENDT